MNQIIRCNMFRKGYCLFSTKDEVRIIEQPLDKVSIDIPQAYIRAQNLIDNFLMNNSNKWTISVVSDKNNSYILYGCKLSISDEKGRSGLSFVHGIEFFDAVELYEHLMSILKLLSSSNASKVIALVSGMARDTSNPETLLNFPCKFINKNKPTIDELNLNYAYFNCSSIYHDCGGANAIAWFTAISSYADGNQSFELYETISDDGTTITIINTPEISDSRLLLSDLVSIALQDTKLMNYVQSRRRSSILGIQSKPKKREFHKLQPQTDSPQSLKTNYQSNQSTMPVNQPINVVRGTNQSTISFEGLEDYFPLLSDVVVNVEENSLLTNSISLYNSRNNLFIANSNNLEGIFEYKTVFKFVLLERRIIFNQLIRHHLILSKRDLPDIMIQGIRNLSTYSSTYKR